MSFLVDPEHLEDAIVRLGREKANWSEAETSSNMSAVIRKAKEAEAGEKVEFNGQQRDTRYRLTNKKIIELLEITPAEEQKMKTIVYERTQKEKEKERKKKQRRSKGVVPRSEYIKNAEEKNHLLLSKAKALREEGLGFRAIAEQLKVSHTHIRNLLKESGSTAEDASNRSNRSHSNPPTVKSSSAI